MGMIDQIIDFNKTSGTTRMEEYVPTLSRDCHDVPLLAKKKDTATKRCLLLGARTDSNRRHSEPQSDALTN